MRFQRSLAIRPNSSANRRSGARYHAIFVPSTALASPGYDGQPAAYLYVAALDVNVLNCRDGSLWAAAVHTGGVREPDAPEAGWIDGFLPASLIKRASLASWTPTAGEMRPRIPTMKRRQIPASSARRRHGAGSAGSICAA